MAGDRRRLVDMWHRSYVNADSETVRAADEIIG